MRLLRALTAIAAVVAMFTAGCVAASKAGHGGTSHAQASKPDYFGCNANDAYLCSSSPPAAGAVGGPADGAPQAQTPSGPYVPPPSNTYSSGGSDCKFYSHPGDSGISLSQDGKTLYGGVLVSCYPVPQLIVTHTTLYYLAPTADHWKQVGENSVTYTFATYQDNTVVQAHTTCAAGYYAVLMNSAGTSSTREEFTAGATSEPLYVPGGACKPMKK